MRISDNILALRVCAVCLSAVGIASPGFAAAQDAPGWEKGDIVLKAGAARILFDSSAEVELGGTPVPGGSLTVGDNTAASFEAAYFFSPEISAAVNFGIPVETSVDGAGTLAPVGQAGRVKYGIGAAVLRYHFNLGSGFSPYLGAGAGHLFIFDESDGALANFEVDGAWAPVVQGGADMHLSSNIGLYANVSYAPLKTDGRGVIFNAPTSAKVTLNPTVVQAGLFFSF